MRNISFAMTTEQVRQRTKTVTRRMGWANLKQGELLSAVVKSQGLKKGEKVERLATIRVKDARRELLDRLTADLDYGFAETAREGFPESDERHWPSEFIAFFCRSHKCKPDEMVTRIEFEYV